MFTFSSPILFLKAVTKKQVFINTFTKDDGTVVPGHYAMVHVSHDHDHEKVATGNGTYSQKKAHKVISAHGHYAGLSTEQQAHHVMEHATELQDKETASANVSKYKAAILAGKKPSDVLMEAYLDAPESKRMAIYQEFETKGVADNSAKYLMEYQAKQKTDTAIEAATEHLKTDQKQSDMPASEKAEDKGMLDKLDDAKGKSDDVKTQAIKEAVEHLKQDEGQDNLPAHEHKEDAQLTDKLESALGGDEYDAKLSEMAALPKGNYKKQAHDKLSKHPEWSNWSNQEKHDKVHAHYQELQSAATAKSNVNTLKKKLKEGKTPTPTEIKSFLAQPKDKQEEDLKGLVHAGVSEEKLSELMKDAFKQPEEPKQAETKPEPKILFTKPTSDSEQNVAETAPEPAVNPEPEVASEPEPEATHEPEKPAESGLEIKTFTHSSKGHTVHSVPIGAKLPDADYKAVAAIAKKHKGFYSSFKKDGAIPGFHFKSDEAAQAFIDEAAPKVYGQQAAQNKELINKETDLQDSDKDQAPIGTKIPMGNGQFEKTEAGWQNQSDKSVLGKLSNIGAALEILSGNTPTQEWYDNKNDTHKEVTAEIVLEQNPDLTASKVLSIIYPAGNDGPKEGDIKTIDGVQYVLQNGRWHKVGENESTNEDVTLENIEVPHFNHNAWDNFLSKLKATAIDPLHGEKDIAITVGKKLISFKNKKNGTKAKMWNPEYNPASITDSDKKKMQFMLSLKSLAGGNVNKKLADWLAENDHPVAGYKGTVLKKKPAPKIIFTKTGEPQVSQTIVKSGITVIDNWEKVGDQKGSNPGGAFKDMSGVQWYCKFPSNPDTVRNELLAAKFYQMMGIAVPNLKLVEKDGKLGIASKWVDGLKSVSSSELAKSDGAHEAFAIDAWLANWDVVGLSNDNLLLDKSGKAVRVDVGGSLLYRAQGGEKGADFGNEVTELKTLIDHGKNSKSAAVFGGITKQDIEASAMKVAKIKPDQIRKMVNLFGPGDDAQKTDLANKLIARRQSIIDQVGIADPWDLPPLDQTKLDVNIKDLPKPHDFHNWNGEGKGLSGSQYYNDLNAKTEQDILDFAMKGNLVALKNYEYTEVDKSSGNELGKKSIADHPSNHIQAFWSDCVSALDQIAHPSIESYDLPGVEGSLHEISEASGFYKLGETIDSVKAEKRFGYWLKLSHAVDIDDIIPSAKTLSVGSIMTQTKEWFSNLSDLTKKMIAGIQSSGSYNDAFRDGKETTKDGSSTVKMTAQAYAESVEMPEGTEIYKWMNMPPAMEDLLLNAEKGTILQNPGSMCCSVHSTGTSNFGKHRLKIRYAKGAKGLNSFGSGAFQSEQEITTLPGARFVVLSAKKGNVKDDGLDVELMMLPPAAGYLNDLAERMKTMVKSYVLFFTKITKAA